MELVLLEAVFQGEAGSHTPADLCSNGWQGGLYFRPMVTKADGQSHVPKCSQWVRPVANFNSRHPTANLVLFPLSPVGATASIMPASFPNSHTVQGEGVGAGTPVRGCLPVTLFVAFGVFF